MILVTSLHSSFQALNSYFCGFIWNWRNWNFFFVRLRFVKSVFQLVYSYFTWLILHAEQSVFLLSMFCDLRATQFQSFESDLLPVMYSVVLQLMVWSIVATNCKNPHFVLQQWVLFWNLTDRAENHSLNGSKCMKKYFWNYLIILEKHSFSNKK